MALFKSSLDLIGNTPIVELGNIEKKDGLAGKVFAKIEGVNPAGSVKDRIALSLIEDAEKTGKLVPGSTVIEPTSGNTGIGLAFVAGQKGYRTVIVMPETMSVERRQTIAAFGAELVLTPGAEGMKGAIKKAEELSKEIPNSFVAGQFVNPANPKAHYEGTGPEIWKDLEGKVDVFIAGVGTGGTLTGVGRYLREKNPNVKLIAVEPAGSPVLSGKPAGKHGLQGIGAGFVPDVLDTKLIDEIITVTEEEAYTTGRRLAAEEGLFVGITSGAAVFAAIKVASRPEFAEKNVVTLLPDGGFKYLSTPLFAKQ